MQKWKKGKGEKRLCRSNDSENEEFQSRERARLLNSPAAKTYMWSSPTHFCSTFRGFRGERKRRELSNRRKKEGNGRFGIGEKLRFDTLIKKQNCNMYLPDLD